MLFADLVGSTELGGSLDPEHTRDLLDRFYDAMAAEIALGGGTVEKFIGDAVVAVFGAPSAREDHAERALDAALSMQLRLSELFGERLALRIGVNTGEVVVGRPREGSSFVTGDPVNVAARLEQAARPGQILVGERTAAAVRSAFEFAEPMSVQAKGKPGGVVCRELVRMVSPTRPRGMGLETAFVGRERELVWLERELDLCRSEQRPRCVSLVGEPGVGKTSLVREFRAAAARRGGLLSRPLRLVRPRRYLQPLGRHPPLSARAARRATRSRPSVRGSPVARSSASHSGSTSAETSTRAALQSVCARSG